jgi:group I intron endonuclease
MKLTEYKSLNFTGIYLITNLISGHCYVGQAKNIASRIRQHLGSTYSVSKKDYNTPLHAAFRKYGLDNFELEVLQKCEYSELNSLEEH